MKRIIAAFIGIAVISCLISLESIALAKSATVFKTNEEFGFLKNVLSTTADSSTDFITNMLKERKFIKDGDAWILSDDKGRIVLYAFRDSFILRYFPKVVSPVPGNVLSAIIEKSSRINMEDADGISIYLGESTLSQGGRNGILKQWIKFRIPEGYWVETSITINWGPNK